MKNSMFKSKPLKIEDNNKPIPQLDINILPTVIKDYVLEVSRVHQIPKEFVAISSLVGISGVLGNKVAINSNSRFIYPILWGMLIGTSGVGKTPSIKHAIEPIKQIDELLLNIYGENKANHKIISDLIEDDIVCLKNQYKKSKDDEIKKDIRNQIINLEKSKPIKPFSREIYINKGKNQAIAKKIADNSPNGLLVHIDELMDWLEDITKPDKRDEQRFYIEGYNGESNKTDTIIRGTEYIKNLALSIVGGVQTSRYMEFIGKYNGSGLIPRFQLLAISTSTPKNFKEDEVEKDIKREYFSLFQKLKDIPERTAIVNSNEVVIAPPKEYFYSNEAKYVFIDWFNANERKKHDDSQTDLIVEYLSKASNTFNALALIFHLSETPENSYISEATANRVVNFMVYLYECVKYLYSNDSMKLVDIAKVVLESKEVITKTYGNKFTKAQARNATRKFEPYSKEELFMSIDYLVEKNHMKLVDKTVRANFYSFV